MTFRVYTHCFPPCLSLIVVYLIARYGYKNQNNTLPGFSHVSQVGNWKAKKRQHSQGIPKARVCC